MEKALVLIVFVSFYIALFSPALFFLSILALLLFLLFSVVVFKFIRFDTLLFVGLILYLLFCKGYSERNIDIPIDRKDVEGIYCKVLSEPSAREKRKKGYSLMLLAIRDSKGSVFNANGILYAITEDSDVHTFDELYLSGQFTDYGFFANSTQVVSPCISSRLRNKIFSYIRRKSGTDDVAQLMQMMLLGSGEFAENRILSLSSQSGLRHVIALSGMHLYVISFIFKPFLLLKRKGMVLISLFLFAFTWLSGWRPSLFRAFIFSLIMRLGKDSDIAFVLSAIVLLSIFPYYGFELASIYSFTALAGIFLLSKEIGKCFSYILGANKLSDGISLSVAAQLFTIPISYCVFGEYQMSSILSSYPAGALISMFMAFSILYIPFPFVRPILNCIYFLVMKLFELSSRFEPSKDLLLYSTMVAIVFFVLGLKFLIKSKQKMRL